MRRETAVVLGLVGCGSLTLMAVIVGLGILAASSTSHYDAPLRASGPRPTTGKAKPPSPHTARSAAPASSPPRIDDADLRILAHVASRRRANPISQNRQWMDFVTCPSVELCLQSYEKHLRALGTVPDPSLRDMMREKYQGIFDEAFRATAEELGIPVERVAEVWKRRPEEARRQLTIAVRCKEVTGVTRECENAVLARLRSPSTADFPGMFTRPEVTLGWDCKYTWRAWVDAQNAYGATVRTTFTCVVDAESNTIDVHLDE